jgi:hypothetical protein
MDLEWDAPEALAMNREHDFTPSEVPLMLIVPHIRRGKGGQMG